ncbi:hypothetical protein NQ318_004787 [Aromia moschata]|uniref:Protein kinase domain-containing protein n=1 Tax=Aromia moschata TaxID=1265417 RepID=A0AAV8XS18_9CUCU|nr:hypothetical protein NQ318_004787 [Aromia moschata]
MVLSNFGRLSRGAAKDLENESDSAWTSVVVRILDATASHRERVMFLNDAAIYRCGSHPHILSLFGRCLDTVPLLLLQEYCSQGDLKGYLKTKADNPDGLFFTDYPLHWCYQLTSALKHLHDNKIVHPTYAGKASLLLLFTVPCDCDGDYYFHYSDLATRNCQLASDLALKLGDYGLSTTKYPEDYYQGSPAIPVRWRSPESLNCTLTTIQSKKITPEDNVWSLGVTVWEIYTCGEQPYSALSDDEVVSQVLGPPNVRLTRPTSSNRNVDYM